jgi:hypothetical protein
VVESQIIYILTNPAMPGLIKIGMTERGRVDDRMQELYSTGVPLPFKCFFAYKVENARKAEDALHHAFGETRINPKREFFTVAPDRVATILKLLPGEEITMQFTKEIESKLTLDEKSSGERFQRIRRPNMNFTDLGIPVGSILKFREGGIEVKVISERKVEYNGEPLFLTTATTRILKLPDRMPLQPSPYWTFDGRRLDDIYEEYHSEEEAA